MSTDQDGTNGDEGNVPDLPELRGGRFDRRFAYAYLSVLFVLPVVALAVLIGFDYITVDVTLQATVAVGWIVEYAVAGLAAIFVVFTFIQVARVAGIGFVNKLAEVVVTVADNYRRPSNRDEG